LACNKFFKISGKVAGFFLKTKTIFLIFFINPAGFPEIFEENNF